ncbi:MAG: AbrB/MazE/SpoVT family DNA-binding domain-containing protein, partial [Pseudonocardiaceae bacterium]
MATSTSSRQRKRRPLHASIRTKGVVTLPLEVREELGLHEGDELIVSVQEGNVVLVPARVIPREQEWFWTPEWQEGEREADREYEQGHGRTGHTFEEFVAELSAVGD